MQTQARADRELIDLTGDVTLAELLAMPLPDNDAAAVAAVRELLIEDGAISVLSHSQQRACSRPFPGPAPLPKVQPASALVALMAGSLRPLRARLLM